LAPRDTRWIIRYGLTGAFAVIVATLPLALVGEVAIRSQLAFPVAAAALVVGFALDALSAYKVHPAYKRLKRPFFVALARCERPLDVPSSTRILQEGENSREATLYGLESARRVDLGVEHAVWIAAFHMHVILACGALALALGALAGLLFDLTELRSGAAAALGVSYAGLSVAFLTAATARLRSYNAKIVNLTRSRTAAGHRGALHSAIAAITDDWAQPGLGAQAFRVCAAAHETQTRDDGEPYVLHPVRVALTLRFELDVAQPESLVLALLHDVLEAPLGHRPSRSQLADAFGPDLAADCELLATKQGATRAERDANYAVAMARASTRVRLVKLADRIDNVRSLTSNPDRAKPARYLRETERHYLDLAGATSPVALAKLEDAIAEVRSTLGLAG
jgi:hypothetical protein